MLAEPTRYAGAAASGVAFGRGYFFQASSCYDHLSLLSLLSELVPVW